MNVVYLLWFKGHSYTHLFGVYRSIPEANEAQERYTSSGKCKDGYFEPIQAAEVNKDLATGYLPDGIKRVQQ